MLDVHGWADLQPEFNALSKQGRWAEMWVLSVDALSQIVDALGH